MTDDRCPKVLVIDPDGAVARFVSALLADEGMLVSILHSTNSEVIKAAVGKLEPDCVLLDIERPGDYEQSWAEAIWLHLRSRSVPTIMFTTDTVAVQEAIAGQSERSKAAAFVAVLSKPLQIEALLDAVREAIVHSVPFEVTSRAEAARTRQLIKHLEELGMLDIEPSHRREWVTFRTPDGVVVQLYWWQQGGVYLVGRYRATGKELEHVGQFYDLNAAIQAAIST